MATEVNFLAHDQAVQHIAGTVAQDLDESYPRGYTRARAEITIRRTLNKEKGELDEATTREYIEAVWQAVKMFGQHRVREGELTLLRAHTSRAYYSSPEIKRSRELWRTLALDAIHSYLLQRGNVTETLTRKYEVALMRYCAQKIHERVQASKRQPRA